MVAKRQKSRSIISDNGAHDSSYGGICFDSYLYTCSECSSHLAFGHSVRIRQDEDTRPVCVDCRLNVRRAA